MKLSCLCTVVSVCKSMCHRQELDSFIGKQNRRVGSHLRQRLFWTLMHRHVTLNSVNDNQWKASCTQRLPFTPWCKVSTQQHLETIQSRWLPAWRQEATLNPGSLWTQLVVEPFTLLLIHSASDPNSLTLFSKSRSPLHTHPSAEAIPVAQNVVPWLLTHWLPLRIQVSILSFLYPRLLLQC
jgi:hypothetical protein